MSAVLTIRADCSPTMGTGHVMRMIALGQAWRNTGGTVRFIGDFKPLDSRLVDEGFETLPLDAPHPDPNDLATLLDATNPGDMIVLDGYHFDRNYQQSVRNAGRKTLVVDDVCDRNTYETDILLNQNPDAAEYAYSLNKDANLLLGPRYTLLRTEFLRHTPDKKTKPQKATNILITLGGADPANQTSKVIEALAATDMENSSIKIVAGAANPYLSILREQISSLTGECDLLIGVDDMASLMKWADLTFTAAGSTCWELCYLGVPMIAFKVADNQAGIHSELERREIAVCLDSDTPVRDITAAFAALRLDAEKRTNMAAKGRALIDGKGALRVVNAIRNTRLRLRHATIDDCKMLLDWRNHPSVRAQSFNPAPIAFDGHKAWFEGKLKDEACLLLIAEDETGAAVGQVRFDRDKRTAIVSVAVAPDMTGRGIGTAMMRLACVAMNKEWPGTCALAQVKTDNPASASMFRKAGFTEVETAENDQLRFEWNTANNAQE